MPVDRPTFSESWYRVATLRPRLRSTIQTYRQHYRGQMWHVVRDPGNNQFFRLDEPGYTFVAMLDGNRTVEQVWDVCSGEMGDRAPTQQEVIQLLGQLYTSNLLAAELPADAAGMFDRYKRRVRREVGAYMQNLLFIRIPLIDPDAFLDRWVGLFGLAFTKIAFVLWLILLGFGFNALSGRWGDLFESGRAENILDPDNMIWLYLSFAIIKGIHEFGHAFACKKFGRDRQSGGEVHTIGIMFLVFMPVPYVDASSSWALRSKRHRMIIAAGGMYIELAIAAVAAMIWANTEAGVIHAIMFNIMFIASVSTILFNGNPLLRFDAYYLLSDFLEVANLAQRSKQYIYYAVKKYVYGVRRPLNPAHSVGERFWLSSYGVASACYRVFIFARILLFVADKLFVLGALLCVAGVFTWVFLPLGKWAHYLATSPDLVRTRPRAVMSTASFVLILGGVIGLVPWQEHDRAQGVVEPRNLAFVYMDENGFIDSTLETNTSTTLNHQALLAAHNPELEKRQKQLEADRRRFRNLINVAKRDGDMIGEKSAKELLEVVGQELVRVRQQIESLDLSAPIEGQWVLDKVLEDAEGAYLTRGNRVGVVADLSSLIIRAVTDQELGPRIKMADDRLNQVQVRVKGRPDILFHGQIEDVYDAAQEQLPYPSLGYAVGGSVQTALDDPSGTQAAEQFFEARIGQLETEDGETPRIYPGQRVVVRFNLGEQPLAWQWSRKIRQLVLRRFHTMF